MTPVLDLPSNASPRGWRRCAACPTDAARALAPPPLRVAPAAADTYEVLDGFKCLVQWTREGHTHAPVVVEDAAGVVAKARLLEANAPRRTLSPMDRRAWSARSPRTITLRARGYTGGRTILKDFLRTLGPRRDP